MGKKFWIRFSFLVLVSAYCLTLLLTEYFTSTEYAQNFFTEIEGPVMFYGLNTTFTSFFLLATSLIFVLALVMERHQDYTPEYTKFFFSQFLIFLYIGLTDRFCFHQIFAFETPFVEALTYSIIFGVFLLTYLTWGLNFLKHPKISTNLFLSLLFFLFTAILDSLHLKQIPLATSLTGITKALSCIFIFLFAWDIVLLQIQQLKAKNTKGLL